MKKTCKMMSGNRKQKWKELQLRRSACGLIPISEKLNISSTKGQSYSGIQIKDNKFIEYDSKMAIVIAIIMCTLNEHQVNRKVEVGIQNVVTYMLNKAIKKIGQSTQDAALKEMKQLLDHKCLSQYMHIPSCKQSGSISWSHYFSWLRSMTEQSKPDIVPMEACNGTRYPVEVRQA